MLQEDKEVSTTSCLLNRLMPLDVSYRVMFSVWNFALSNILYQPAKEDHADSYSVLRTTEFLASS